MEHSRLLWVYIGGAIWTCWYVYGETVLLRKYRTNASGRLLALEWCTAVLTVAVLTVCARLSPLSGVGRHVAVAGITVLALVPLVVELALWPPSTARHIVSVFHVSAYIPALAAIPWALAVYPPRLSALICALGVVFVWLAWGLGLGLWRACNASVVGACAGLVYAVAIFCEMQIMVEPVLIPTICIASLFVRYDPKPRLS